LRWANETPEVKAHFNKAAEIERHEHMEKYPDFKYSSRQKVVKKKSVGTANWQLPTPPDLSTSPSSSNSHSSVTYHPPFLSYQYFLPPPVPSQSFASAFSRPTGSIMDIAKISDRILNDPDEKKPSKMKVDNLIN
jgi:hypothetical protein